MRSARGMPPDRIGPPTDSHRAGQPTASPQLRETPAQADQTGDEVDQTGIGVFPVEPGQRIVLAVGIVVAGLRASELIATQQHRHPLRQHQRGEKCALQSPAFFEDCRIVALAFLAAVPGRVVAVAVAIVLAIEFIVFLLVADEITQGEAVMRGDEVDSCLGRASVGAEDFARPGKPLRQLSDACSVRQPEGADVIAEAVVPFAPAR